MHNHACGFSGQILRINLIDKSITKEDLDLNIARQFLGGTGYASKILWDELDSGIDPLGPRNKLILSAGLLTATGCPGSDSLFSCFKSPLTNCWGEARCGGGMGPEMKRAGFDMVIIEGVSEKPVYISIIDGNADIRKAGHLWGKLVPETQTMLRDEINEPQARILCIGRAGEKLVRFSNIMVEHLRTMGRCGGGAVMGSKKLKAVIFRGRQKIKVAEPEHLKILIKEMVRLERSHPVSGLSKTAEKQTGGTFRSGTASFLPAYDELGETPTQNALSNSWGKGADMYRTLKTHISGSEGCMDCVLKCGKWAGVKEGKWKTPNGHYPEYETMVGFGHYLLNDNVEAIIHLNHICNCNGIDTISSGNAIAFAMECYEKGYITQKDLGGLELTWGNMDTAKTLLDMIIERKGFGDLLAEGIRIASKNIGGGSAEAAMHVKGLELPAHDTRSKDGGKVWAIQYGTAGRGMCHVHPHEPVVVHACCEQIPGEFKEVEERENPYSEKGRGRMVKWAQDYGNAINTLGLCNFHSYLIPGSDPIRYTKILKAVSGWEINLKDLLKIGERVSNIQRCFNVREGIRRKDDYIPKRLMTPPAFGPFSSRPETEIQNYDTMLDEYYVVRGWHKKSGIPTRKKLNQLGLEPIEDNLP